MWQIYEINGIRFKKNPRKFGTSNCHQQVCLKMHDAERVK